MFKIRSIFDEIDEEAEARAIAEADADIDAARFVSHEKAVKWLRSWGTPDEIALSCSPAPVTAGLREVIGYLQPQPGFHTAAERLGSVVWTLSAVTDLEVIRRYIGNFNPYAARAMAAQMIEAGNCLAISPYRGRSVPVPGPQLRALTLARPYIIHYRLRRAGVLILRVRHGARRLR